ncbi:MAG: extracellular repeat protein family [Chthonomonadaceae bacterium]|nr:extracellular repeat protein family [Chthonomonadaceae bacterium]
MRIGISRILGTAALLTTALFSLLPAGAQIKVNSLGGGTGGSIYPLPLTYHVYDLGTLGGTSSNAFAINNNNQVVGYSTVYTIPWIAGITHAFRHNGTTPLNSASDDLSTLGGANSIAYAINSQGTVVGTAQDHNGTYEAFRHVGAGALNPTSVYQGLFDDFGDLGEGANLPNDGFAVANGINDNDNFVGYSVPLINIAAFEHMSGQGALFNRLLYMLAPQQNCSYAYGVSTIGGSYNQGVTVGMSRSNANNPYHAMVVGNGSWNQWSDMGTLGGSSSCALAINNKSVIAGWSELFPGFSIRHAFRHVSPYQPIATIGAGTLNDLTDDLGVIGGSNSEAHAINKYNVVVGKSEWSGSGTHAFFYDTGMNDLNNYLDASSTAWTLSEANGINDAGVIVGQGLINGAYHAFVAVPNPRWPLILLP